MTLKEAINIINGSIDYYYEEHCSNGNETEEYKELEKAETILTLLVKRLEEVEVNYLKDLRSVNGRLI